MNLTNLNWELYIELIEYKLTNNPIDSNVTGNRSKIDSIITKFTNIIVEAATKSVELKTYQNNSNISCDEIENTTALLTTIKKNLIDTKKLPPSETIWNLLLKKATNITRFSTKKNSFDKTLLLL